MEVSPEIYAWLSSLNIIEPFDDSDKNGNKGYFIPEKILNSLFNGEYFSAMILSLQDAYNRYYDNRKDCSSKLKELVFKEKNYEKISEKTRINNWNVINEALKIFGIKYSKNDLNKIINENDTMLLKIITNIFNTITQYLKYVKKDTNTNNDKTNKNKTIKNNNNLNTNPNLIVNGRNDKIMKKDYSNSILNSSVNEPIKIINKNISESSLNNNFNSSNNLIQNNSEIEANNNEIVINENQNNNTKNNNTNVNTNNKIIINHNNKISEDILDSPRPLTEYVDVDKLSGDTLYENCTSTLEFFIVTLCKNFKISPIQAIGLLSNNRHYLSVMCSSGINGNYTSVKKWLEDLQINYDILSKLIFKYGDGVYMTYCIIGTALCSKNYDVSLYAVDLLSQLNKNVGLNYQWFYKNGIYSFIYAFIKHGDRILYFLNILCDFIKGIEEEVFKEIKNKMNSDEEYKILIYDILPDIIDVSKNIKNKKFFNIFKDFVFDICLHEEKKLTYSCSVLCESFYLYYQLLNEDLIKKIVLFFKKCLRNNNSNIYGSTISKIFVLINNLAVLYNENAPPLYKCLIFLFIDMYDELEKREIFLINFGQFLNEHKMIPLDIFFEPYFSKLKQCKNYNLCDFCFLFNILDHPRIEYNDILDIINFLLSVSFNNYIYNKCSIFIFEKMLVELLPNKYIDNRQIQDLSMIFVNYIKEMLDIYVSNENGNKANEDGDDEDKNENLLEMSYFIVQQGFIQVNTCVKLKIIECAKMYYDIHKKHSGIFLGMLKKYPDFGNILFQIEQQS